MNLRSLRMDRVWGMIAVLALVAAACSGNSGQAGSAGADQALSASGEPVYFDATDKAYFSTLGQMADAAEIVVLGEIVDVELGPILSAGAPAGEDAFLQMALYKVRVDEALKGSPDEVITVARESFVVSGDDLRPLSFNGIMPNQVGDAVLWFLETVPSNPGMWEQVSLDGLLGVSNGRITTDLDGKERLANSLKGQPLASVLAELRRGS